MAAPTSTVNTQANVLAAGSSTPLDTNQATRQMVQVQNNGPQAITLVTTSGGAAIPTVGLGWVLQPGQVEVFWIGTGVRLYGRVGPVAPGDTAVDQVSPANLNIVEMA